MLVTCSKSLANWVNLIWLHKVGHKHCDHFVGQKPKHLESPGMTDQHGAKTVSALYMVKGLFCLIRSRFSNIQKTFEVGVYIIFNFEYWLLLTSEISSAGVWVKQTNKQKKRIKRPKAPFWLKLLSNRPENQKPFTDPVHLQQIQIPGRKALLYNWKTDLSFQEVNFLLILNNECVNHKNYIDMIMWLRSSY